MQFTFCISGVSSRWKSTNPCLHWWGAWPPGSFWDRLMHPWGQAGTWQHVWVSRAEVKWAAPSEPLTGCQLPLRETLWSSHGVKGACVKGLGNVIKPFWVPWFPCAYWESRSWAAWLGDQPRWHKRAADLRNQQHPFLLNRHPSLWNYETEIASTGHMSDASHHLTTLCPPQLHEAVKNKEQKPLTWIYDIKLKEVFLFIIASTLNNYLASTSLI